MGRYVEAAGRARAVRSLAPMLAAEKQSVCVLEDGAERHCPACDVTPGTIVLIRPGERIGVDGGVIEGRSHADEAAMTGESRLIEKGPGSRVLAGTINGYGPLTVRSECAGTATHWARICRSVRQSLRQGHELQRLADRVGSAFIPIVLLIALGTVWWWSGSVPPDEAWLHGLAVLVVACPCALGLATPLASSLGVGRLARQGCVVRGAAVTEALAQIRAIAFDKTGTLTSGEPCLVDVIGDGLPADEVLRWTAGVERYAEHPLATGIMRAVEEQALVPMALTDVQAVPGCGVRGHVMGRTAVVGSRDWVQHLGASMSADLAERARSAEAIGRTVVCLAWADRVRGLLLFEDTIRLEACTTVRALRQLGLETGILSGAAQGVVDRIGDLVGIELREAELSPEGKQAFLEGWRRSFGPVAMVGDGLNDGPVLAAADVGVAIGSATDLAREAADLVLPESGLAVLPWAIGLARAVRRTILTNLFWAFGYNSIAIALAATGFLQPIAAALVMAGSSLVVVLNSLQIERHGEPDAPPGPISAPEIQPA